MASLMDAESDDEELLSPSIVTKPFDVTPDMVDNILAVCPDASRDAITADLRITRSITTTINRILDGVVISESHQRKEISLIPKSSPLKAEDKFGTTSDCKIQATTTYNKGDIVCLSDTDIDTDDNDDVTCRNINIKDGDDDGNSMEVMEVDKEIVSNQCEYQISPSREKLKNIYNTSEIIIDLSFDDDQDDNTAFSDKNISKESLKTKHNTDKLKTVQESEQASSSEHCIQIDCDDKDETCEVRLTDISLPSYDSDSESLPSVIPMMRDRISSHMQEFQEEPLLQVDNFKSSGSQSHAVTMDMEESCVPTKRMKCSSDENLTKKEQAKLKREEREKERQAKKEDQSREKQAKQDALVVKRKEKEMGKLLKQAESMDQKCQRREECLKNVEVCLDHDVVSSMVAKDDLAVNPVVEKLTSLGVCYSFQSHAVPESITWKRVALKHTVGEDLKIHEQKTLTEENHVLVRLGSDLFISMADTFIKTRNGCSGSDSSPHSIESFCHTLKIAYGQKDISLVVLGLDKYFRDLKAKKARQYRNACRGDTDVTENNKSSSRKKTSPSLIVSQVDVEEFLVFIELTTEFKIILCESMQDFAETVAMFTKAVAEAPFKKSQPQAFSFCVDSFKSSVKVTKDGDGFLKLWQRQLQQFNNVSANMAAAIVAAYPSPQLLVKAYKECPNEQSATLLLKDIVVRRGTGVLATSRRIGPELSRQIYLFFNATDGQSLTK